MDIFSMNISFFFIKFCFLFGFLCKFETSGFFLSQSSQFFNTMSSLAHGMRVNYSQKAFVFVIHLSSERAGELVYRLSKCQAMGSLQNVPFRAICLKGCCQLSAIRGAVRRVGRRNYSHLTHRRDT